MVSVDIDAVRIQHAKLLAFAEAVEQWEADLLMSSECWTDGLPRMNQELYDKWMALQIMRNVALDRDHAPDRDE